MTTKTVDYYVANYINAHNEKNELKMSKIVHEVPDSMLKDFTIQVEAIAPSDLIFTPEEILNFIEAIMREAP